MEGKKMIKSENGKTYVEIDVTTKYETDKAVLFDTGNDEDVWVPKSVMEDWPSIGDSSTALIEEWFAIEKELV